MSQCCGWITYSLSVILLLCFELFRRVVIVTVALFMQFYFQEKAVYSQFTPM